MLQQEHTKELNNNTYIFGENTLVFYPLPLLFLKGRTKFLKNWVGGNFFKKYAGET